jgi:ABC-type arginine transport system permease subunit
MMRAATMAASAITEPTERSIPPVMITQVMPIAMMPMAAKLRVMLKKLPLVAKVSGWCQAVTRQSRITVTVTQNAWLATVACQ